MAKPTDNNIPRTTPGPRRRWFREGKLKCAWKPCGRPMPSGYYGTRKRIYFCDTTCRDHYHVKKHPPLKCEYCGRSFKPKRPRPRARFCCIEHFALWRRKQTEEKKFGGNAALVSEFIDACVRGCRTRKSVGTPRYSLVALFVYLRKKRLRSLASVSPRHISSFFSHLRKTRPKSAARVLTDVRLFFDWLIATGRRSKPNPVLKKVHTQLSTDRLPSPYSRADLKQISQLLDAAADPRLTLAVAIGLEAGLQIAELCELRVGDVDLEGRCLRVRASNRTGLERSALFHTRTKKALEAWLKQRPQVDHDYLLTGDKGTPMRKYRLRACLKEALCGPEKLPQFSFRRLRQTATARVFPEMDRLGLMANFGWRSERAVEGFRRLPTDDLLSSYAEAMEQLREQPQQPQPRSESMDEYFKPEAGSDIDAHS